MSDPPRTAGPPDLAEARAAKAELLGRLAGHPAVNGVGLAHLAEGYAVKVNLSEGPPAAPELPAHVGRVEVRVEVVGTIRRR